MRSSRCLYSTARALHKTFVSPPEYSQLSSVLARRPAPLPISFRPNQQHRHVSNKSVSKPTTAEKSRLPRDDEITDYSIVLVDADGKMTAPRSTQSVLANLNRKVNTLVVVVPGNEYDPPICKILNKKAMREAEKARLKAAKSGGVTTKTMELNWAIEKGDLAHRMGKLRMWLEKGWRVEVVLAGKKRGKKATEDEAKGLLAVIRSLLGGVGGKENKPMEGKLSRGEGMGVGTVTLYLEGKKPSVQTEQKGQAEEKAGEEGVAVDETLLEDEEDGEGKVKKEVG
ncbi:hypothetical protein QTJ16_000027 [Diplocarpon rosae]|uniref:Translation initiation factor 3 N-terminal domain-containing protein n=1 Tax=Diplocarpon rosae TaxID=946125 RepID=A0AAD9WEZ7_9HELO|nr:hypothetical protein QTJ16_000027 [Diplocarpon rosae]